MDLFGTLVSVVSTSFWLIVPFIFVLTVVVFVHELGHFLAARLCGVRIDAFSIGFGPELLAWVDRYGTRWRVAALPLGGYVKFWGDADATTSRVNEAALAGASDADRASSFHYKPLHQKAFIAVAGPLANFILAIVVFAGLNMVIGERVLPPRFGEVAQGSPADVAGLRAGDVIKSVNGQEIETFLEFAKLESLSGGSALVLKIQRNDETFSASVTPRLEDRDDGQGGKVAVPSIGVEPYLPAYITNVLAESPAAKAGVLPGDLVLSVDEKPVSTFAGVVELVRVSGGNPLKLVVDRDGTSVSFSIRPELDPNTAGGKPLYRIGIGSNPDSPDAKFKVEREYFGPIGAVSKAVGDVKFIISKIGEFFGQLLTGTGDYRQLSGPIGIAKVSSDVAQVSLAELVRLIAVLSVSIGLLNLLPIPILDGGHLLYYAVEAIRGQPLGERAQEFGFRIGLVFVLGLMVVATWNDIVKVKFWLF